MGCRRLGRLFGCRSRPGAAMADNTSDFFSAKAFHRACDRSGMTKKAIAAALGVTPTTLSSLYSGRSTPSMKLLHKMVEFFGGELVDFLELPSRQRWELKHYRIAAGLTQAALAKRLEVAPSAVSGWELGKYAPGGPSSRSWPSCTGFHKPISRPLSTCQRRWLRRMRPCSWPRRCWVSPRARSACGAPGMPEPERQVMFAEIRSRVEQALSLLAPLIPQLPEDSRSRAVSLVRRLSEVHEAVTSK
ncbi:helix-turn-helix family protein [Mycobacterium xenopi 4042]|uniref:Helix-turn-helix family protein n=3 Tax=Mycobacterium xenopi 4042 TaxID=1299334 RepID=X8DD67_MYCXE|nr:helix-turn-helix family protein [Mycobacterium xenopi 4042]